MKKSERFTIEPGSTPGWAFVWEQDPEGALLHGPFVNGRGEAQEFITRKLMKDEVKGLGETTMLRLVDDLRGLRSSMAPAEIQLLLGAIGDTEPAKALVKAIGDFNARFAADGVDYRVDAARVVLALELIGGEVSHERPVTTTDALLRAGAAARDQFKRDAADWDEDASDA